MSKIFKTATAFRKSLESRLMNISQETNIDLQRLRRKVAFDRLLARFFINDSNTWVLKGGYALERPCCINQKFTTEHTESTEKKLNDDPAEPLLQNFDVEIHQQAHLASGKFEIRD